MNYSFCGFPAYLCALLARDDAGQQIFNSGELSEALTLRRDQQGTISRNFSQSCTGCH